MTDTTMLFTAITHMISTLVRPADSSAVSDAMRDRGAVSIEQVLWYAAAAVSVAVVATIIWTQIRTTASTPVNTPVAP